MCRNTHLAQETLIAIILIIDEAETIKFIDAVEALPATGYHMMRYLDALVKVRMPILHRQRFECLIMCKNFD